MITEWLNQPKDLLAVTAALLTDLAYLPFVSDLFRWESGRQKWMAVVASMESGKLLNVE